jgi:hypothetical protein
MRRLATSFLDKTSRTKHFSPHKSPGFRKSPKQKRRKNRGISAGAACEK